MLGFNPFYFYVIFIFLILKGASVPLFYLGILIGGF